MYLLTAGGVKTDAYVIILAALRTSSHNHANP